jgi:polar amino acid transport system ATP-binding protein
LKNVSLALDLQKIAKAKKEKRKINKSEIEKENAELATKLLSDVGLADKLNNYPCELSGGQQQRVAIARALALSPDVLCFDEPTSALDPELTGEVLKVIKSLKSKDRTMIIVTHEMDFAKNVSDKVIFMSDGKIEEIGTANEIFESPKNPKTISFLTKSKEEI